MEQTILITGADKGLGFSLAKRFLQGGYGVFAGIHVSDRNLKPLAENYPGLLTTVPLDVAEIESVRAAARQVAALAPALDIVINNAAIYPAESPQPLEQLDFDAPTFQRTMEINAFGPLRVVQQFCPLLEKGRRKLIVNISSEAGSLTDCQRQAVFAYCMSKAALNMQSKILQNYLGARGFKVLAVHPGWLKTDMGGPDATLPPDDSAEGIYQLTQRQRGLEEAIYMDHLGNELPW